jgi:hypothetical protein
MSGYLRQCYLENDDSVGVGEGVEEELVRQIFWGKAGLIF